MKVTSANRTRAALGPALLGLSLTALAASASGPEERAPARSQAFEERTLLPGRYLGVASCASSNCHGSIDARDDTDVLQNEYLTWLDNDPHSQSYNTLFNEDSALIVSNLGLERAAYEEQQCLRCHTLVVPARLQVQSLDLDEGISCEACHGPSSGWFGEHAEEGWSHRDSLSRGMIDLRRSAQRGRVCLHCHQGDSEASVDHELLAAGHPRLLFELDNFTGGLPPHWLERPSRHGAGAWAVGQMVAFREGLKQLASRARSGKWPEFAEMSCESCHHSLEEERWRQGRSRTGTRGGLPPWSPHRWAVLRHLVAKVDTPRKERLDPMIAELAASVARMSEPERTAELAEAVTAELEPALADLERIRWSSVEARDLLRRIAADRDDLVNAGIQPIEQAFLAINSLVSHLAAQDRSVLQSPLAATVEALDRELTSRHRFDRNRLEALLRQLGEQL